MGRFRTHYGQSWLSYWFSGGLHLLIVGLVTLLLAACNSGSGDSTVGDVSISLTDASGDFASYTVDVTSLQLVKQNGTVVSALPTTTRIDFAQYTDLSEFLTVATVPSGRYTRVVLNLDYSNADVVVQDSSGTYPATMQDGDGNPLTTMSVSLDLASGHPLVILPGVPASLALDFDLNASNQVDFTQTPPVVQVEPFLVADLSLDSDRQHRARGLLQDVDTTAQSFTMQLRPFAVRQHRWGLITVNSASTTRYEIDGVAYDGQDGIDQLALLSADTPVIVVGSIAGRKLLDATAVLAGSSVPWDNKDVVQGTVIKRSGDTLTVRGHYVDRIDGIAIFNSDITVTVDSATDVTAPLSGQTTIDKDSISVGQAITALGTLDLSAPPYTLDSTGSDNIVRMDVTRLLGSVNTINSSLLNTDLAYINGRQTDIFDFSGTGVSAADDSDPLDYDVETGSLLSGMSITNGDVVKLRGFVVPFGQASTSGDFSAISVIDLNQDLLAASMGLYWQGGTAAAFSSIASDAIVIDVSFVTDKHVWLDGVSVDLSATTAITLTPQKPLAGRFAIKLRGQSGISLYRQFANFSTALTTAMNNGYKVELIAAHGAYSSADATLDGAAILILLTP